jgi:chromosome segregation ATPase
MADSKTNELKQRRSVLSESLSALGRKRDETYRLNSDALALDRAGVTHHAKDELARLGQERAEAEAAIRDVQSEIRNLDAEIQRGSGGGIGARVARIARRPRSGSR